MKAIQPDKFKHDVYGYIITALLSLVINPFFAFGICILVGISKEVIWDKALGKGQFEWADMVWTWAGGLMALLPQIMYLIKNLLI
jgi:hypothetical protein